MIRFWNRIINIGITTDLPSEDIRKIRLLNGILIIGETIFILLIIKSLISGLPQEYLIQGLGAFLFLIPIYFNHLKKHKIAKLLCLLIPIFYLSFLTIYWGSDRGSQLILFAVTGLAVLFFENTRAIFWLVFLSSTAILSVEVYNFIYDPIYIPPNIEIAYLINVVITIIMINVIVGIFKKENYEYQNQIATINKKITKQHNKVVELNQNLSHSINIIKNQKEAIDEAHKRLQDSINYAQTIQKSILTLSPQLKNKLPEHFILFKPRDVVSGDFYYFYEYDGKLYVAAVDCTGHGVPGAFMSMIGYNLLQEAIETERYQEANLILNFLNEKVNNALKQRDTQNFDGMDISLIILNKKTNKIKFAGAKNSLIVVSRGELSRYQGDRFAIGGFTKPDHEFSQIEIQLQKDDTIYLLTDGYQDQFGGPNNKKFRRKRLFGLLQHMWDVQMAEQQLTLTATFKAWKEKAEQTDDILIIGLRL